MEFVFKPEKLTPELMEQVSSAIGRRLENASREKCPELWKKIDSLNGGKAPEDVLRRRRNRRRFYGIILLSVGFFLFVPGLMKPDELFVPLIVGAFSMINGIFAVLHRKTKAERYEKQAKKLMKRINSSIESGDTVVFAEEGIFENGTLLMEYKNLEPVIEERSLFLVCDGGKVLVLRKFDLVSGDSEDFSAFINNKNINIIKLE